MAKFRSRARVSRGTRRKWVWARVSIDPTILGVESSLTGNMLGPFEAAYGANLIGVTACRIRGNLTMTGAANGSRALFGVLKEVNSVSPDPLAVHERGPINTPFADWMMFETFSLVSGSDTTGRMVDNKAMRTLQEVDEQLSWYWSTPASNSDAVTVQGYLSIGVKLP